MDDAWKPVIGTLAHNRQFSAAEITDYTRYDRAFDGPKVVRALLKAGYLTRVERGQYYPTPAGWDWIEGPF